MVITHIWYILLLQLATYLMAVLGIGVIPVQLLPIASIPVQLHPIAPQCIPIQHPIEMQPIPVRMQPIASNFVVYFLPCHHSMRYNTNMLDKLIVHGVITADSPMCCFSACNGDNITRDSKRLSIFLLVNDANAFVDTCDFLLYI